MVNTIWKTLKNDPNAKLTDEQLKANVDAIVKAGKVIYKTVEVNPSGPKCFKTR
jgi:hypothetical protein